MRAKPLSLDDRRQAIVEAATPLILEQGAQVSTRQIAEVCGLAEGTLFRAFPSKSAIVDAVVHDVMAPEPIVAEIDAIDRDAPLEDRLADVCRVLFAGARRIRLVIMLFHAGRIGGDGDRDEAADHAFMHRRQALVIEALGRLLAPDAHRLRTSPELAAAYVQGTIVASVMGMHDDPLLGDPDLIADLIVNGLVDTRDRGTPSAGTPPSSHQAAPSSRTAPQPDDRCSDAITPRPDHEGPSCSTT